MRTGLGGGTRASVSTGGLASGSFFLGSATLLFDAEPFKTVEPLPSFPSPLPLPLSFLSFDPPVPMLARSAGKLCVCPMRLLPQFSALPRFSAHCARRARPVPPHELLFAKGVSVGCRCAIYSFHM